MNTATHFLLGLALLSLPAGAEMEATPTAMPTMSPWSTAMPTPSMSPAPTAVPMPSMSPAPSPMPMPSTSPTATDEFVTPDLTCAQNGGQTVRPPNPLTLFCPYKPSQLDTYSLWTAEPNGFGGLCFTAPSVGTVTLMCQIDCNYAGKQYLKTSDANNSDRTFGCNVNITSAQYLTGCPEGATDPTPYQKGTRKAWTWNFTVGDAQSQLDAENACNNFIRQSGNDEGQACRYLWGPEQVFCMSPAQYGMEVRSDANVPESAACCLYANGTPTPTPSTSPGPGPN